MQKHFLRSLVSRLALIAVVVAVLWLGYVFLFVQARNDRDWEYGMDVLPSISIAGRHGERAQPARFPIDGGRAGLVGPGSTERLSWSASRACGSSRSRSRSGR